jgi:hypothetical protein
MSFAGNAAPCSACQFQRVPALNRHREFERPLSGHDVNQALAAIQTTLLVVVG